MNENEPLYGTPIACVAEIPHSLGDLIRLLEDADDVDLAMLRSTSNKLVAFLRLSTYQIPIDRLVECRDDFARHLKDGKYEANSVRTYLNYHRILLRRAAELGWSPNHVASAEWEAIQPQAVGYNCKTLMRQLGRRGISPSQVTEDDLEAWIKQRVVNGYAYHTAYQQSTHMRRLLIAVGYGHNFDLKRVDKMDYGIPLRAFPDVLRGELEALLKWKQAAFAPNRPKRGKTRPSTAQGIQQAFSQLLGYMVNVAQRDMPGCLGDMLNEAIITDFAVWSIEFRDVASLSVVGRLRKMTGAVRHYPPYASRDWGWIDRLIASLPEQSHEALYERKEKKYLPYETVIGISGKIRADRAKAKKKGQKKLAMHVRNELLLALLSNLAWRQVNLRECRINGVKPNLFSASIPKLATVTRPKWAKEVETRNPAAAFWQFKFSEDETKNGRSVHCILPRRLVSLLEEYVNEHRIHLVTGTDPGTLFLSGKGKKLTPGQINCAVSEMTLRYGGKVVTPHLFRDIYAYHWLEMYPEDYLTVSKMLWHRNVNITLMIYGRRFNESTAMARLEDLLG